MLEREHLDAVMNERNLLSISDPSTAAKLGRIAGAQYIITGAITLYYYSEKGSGFLLPILGAVTQAKTAYVTQCRREACIRNEVSDFGDLTSLTQKLEAP